MKRKFTFLIAAAFILLTMMATTGRMWGQTIAEEVYKTTLFGKSYNSQGVSGYNNVSWYSTTEGFRMDIVNANNNNTWHTKVITSKY